jgi:hypothetical protein
MKTNHSAGFMPGSLPAPPWHNFSSAYGLDFTADGSGALLANLSRRNTLFYGVPKDRGVLAQCGSQFGKTFMTFDWNIGMQNAATLASGEIVTVLCLCQGDRYQNWIFPPLNMSMYSLNAFGSLDGGITCESAFLRAPPCNICTASIYMTKLTGRELPVQGNGAARSPTPLTSRRVRLAHSLRPTLWRWRTAER